MKNFLTDSDGNLSMGRLLSMILFFICCGMWILKTALKIEISNNDMTLIQWGWITAIGGKAIQKFAEAKK